MARKKDSVFVKSIPFEMKLDEEKRIIEGYASTFGNKDLVGDVVQPGAFKKTVDELFPKNQIKFCWQHGEPIGRPIFMQEDSKGLYVQARIAPTTLGNDALALVKENVIDSMSIGYNVIQDEYDTTSKTRYLKELRLKEFSLVTFPANEEALVTGVKTAEDFRNVLLSAGRMDVSQYIKQGKDLEEGNRELIESTIEALQSILAAFEPEDPDTDDLDEEEEASAEKSAVDLHHSKGKKKQLDIYDTQDLQTIQNILKNFSI